jgi:hypothetical protein
MPVRFPPDCAAIERLKGGLFGPHVDSFVATLCQLGYADRTVHAKLRLLDALARWLGRLRLVLAGLHEAAVQRFLEERRKRGRQKKRLYAF